MVLIDERDNKIIEALRRDCRAPNARIARAVGVSEGTIRRRLNRLMAEGAIEISVTETAQQAEDDDGGDASRFEVRVEVAPQELDDALDEMQKLDEDAAFVPGAHAIVARVKAANIDELKSLDQRVRKRVGARPAISPILGGGESERTAG